MRKLYVTLFATLSLVATMLVVAPYAIGANHLVGDFQIDGNLADDGPGDDWETPSVVATTQTFDDIVGKGDNIFTQGSKNNEPGQWVCADGQVPKKVDLVRTQLHFREVNGEQFLAFNFTRAAGNGDANIEFELNQSADPNPACPQLPQRTDGDLLVAFDTDQGGASIEVRLFEWQFTGPGVGEFQQLTLPDGSWAGAVNIPNTIPGLKNGEFGEGIINMTVALGGDDLECGEFAAVHFKSRASTSINSDLKDRTVAQAFTGPCPQSELSKQVRNVTQGGVFSTSTTADPGDTIEYQITYANTGDGEATNVVITDEVRDHSTLVSCSPDCGAPAGSGPGTTLEWTFASVPAGGGETVSFQVELDDVFPAGTTTITNVASVNTDQEDEKQSNETTVTVEAAPAFTVEKSAASDTVAAGDTLLYTITVTNVGNADGSTFVTDDYDETKVTVDEISDSGVDNGDTIHWASIAVEAGTSRDLTYEATFVGPFDEGAGTGGCDPGQFPVVNTVQVTGDSDSETVCVVADPEFEVEKTADDTTVTIGDVVTYTITVTNVGQGPGSTTVTDDYDEDHLTVDNASIDPAPQSHDEVNGVITWDSGTLQPNESATFTYEATVGGTFTGDPGGGGCDEERFPVINTVTVEGDEDSETICVLPVPEFVVEKSASATTVQVGDTVTFSVTVTNLGSGPGSTTVTDDYDQNHVTVSNISDGGVDNGDTITWDSGTLQPGESVTFTYDATFNGPFSDGAGTGGCDPGTFPVVNTVSVDGDTDSETVCVEAHPDPDLVKSADVTKAAVGENITYTLVYSNNGDATATNVQIREDLPEHTAFVSCSDDCVTTGDPINRARWDVGDVAPNESVTVTLTVEVLAGVGCEICNVARATADNHDEIFSNEVCIAGTPAPDPSGANADGSAFAAHVEVNLLGQQITQQTLFPVSSEQSGVGSDSESDGPAPIAVPGVLSASVLQTSATSTVSETPAQARQVSVAETANVNILDGLVTADLVRASVEAVARGDGASFNSNGSTFKNLVVNGVAMNDVAPGTRVDLPTAVFGSGSYVALYEQTGSTSTPDPGQLSGGTYAADVEVNMIRVHVTALAPLGDEIEVIVANAVAHADFPQTELCDADPLQAVSGHAFIASAHNALDLLPVVVGYTEIPASGGEDHRDLDDANIDGVVTNATAVSHSFGALGPLSSDAHSYAEIENLCLVPDNGGCLVSAELIRSRSNSTASAVGASSDDTGTILVGLNVAGEQILNETPGPNEVIDLPGIGFIVLNEQFCDNDADLDDGCDDGSGHAGLTVRALRLVVTVLDPLGVEFIEVIVAEAHSDATFVL